MKKTEGEDEQGKQDKENKTVLFFYHSASVFRKSGKGQLVVMRDFANTLGEVH